MAPVLKVGMHPWQNRCDSCHHLTLINVRSLWRPCIMCVGSGYLVTFSIYSLRRRSANIPFLQRVVLCAEANFFHFDTLELVLSLANMTWKLKLMLATPNCHFLANEDSVTMINTTNVYWATLLGNAVLQTQELRTAVTKSCERRHWLGCSYAINKLHRHILPLRWHCVGIIKCEKSM